MEVIRIFSIIIWRFDKVRYMEVIHVFRDGSFKLWWVAVQSFCDRGWLTHCGLLTLAPRLAKNIYRERERERDIFFCFIFGGLCC